MHADATLGFGTCLSTIQPLSSENDTWVYGKTIFQNAFFKWDILNGSISMAQYNQTPWAKGEKLRGVSLDEVKW